MSEHYQLKKLYEALLKGDKQEQASAKPRTLSEAYQKKLISERTVFFAKDNEKYTTLGVVEDPEEANEIKNSVKASSIITLTDKLMNEAGWVPNNPVFSSRQFGSMLFKNDIDVLDVDKITNIKSSLTLLEEYITGSKQGEKFNLSKVILEGLEKGLGESRKTPSEKLNSLINSLLVQVGRVGKTNIGPGEIAISLLTNAKKAQRGDLSFNDKNVEVKGSSTKEEGDISGALLGYAKHAVGGALQAKIKELLTSKENVPKRELFKIREEYNKEIESLKAKSSQLFTPTFFEELKSLTPLIVSQDVETLTKNFNSIFGIDVTLSGYTKDDVVASIKKLLSKNYLKPISTETIQNVKDPIFVELQQLLLIPGRTAFVTKLKKLLSQLKKQTNPEVVKASSLTTLTKDFLLSDLGFSAEQVASVLFEARPNNTHRENLLQDIESALSSGYLNRLQSHDVSAYKGLIFALHVSEYAFHEGFQYLLLFNRSSNNALTIPAGSSFSDLLEFYNQHKQQFLFNPGFTSTQGVHFLAVS